MTKTELVQMHISAAQQIADMELSNISVNVEMRLQPDNTDFCISVFGSDNNVSFWFYLFRDNEDKALDELIEHIKNDDWAVIVEHYKNVNANWLDVSKRFAS